ncbi:MAG: VOC family protein [Nannocystis sp.]|nr:VOC family protein [Nannocystis sp.]
MNLPKHTPGRVVWRELMTSDLERAKGFYGELFGWSFKNMPMGPGEPDYPIAQIGDRGVAGLTQKPDPNMPSFWASYVSVTDVDAAAKAAEAGGGAVAFGPMDVPQVGRIAMIMDFDHAALGLLHSSNGDTPPEIPQLGEFCWETLSSSDPARARRFYRDVIGWVEQPSPAGGIVFGVGPTSAEGVADLQEAIGMPAMWLTYVVVEALEAARSRAERLGGQVVAPLIEVPKVGRIAVIADPTGGHFGLFQPFAG